MAATKTNIGRIVWRDLTVPNATEIRDFYKSVVGWQATDHDMEDYCDYNILPPDSEDVITGICHARDTNAGVPPQWMIYIQVEDVHASVQKCLELGGKIIDGPRQMGRANFCVIQDPAGAVCALIDG